MKKRLVVFMLAAPAIALSLVFVGATSLVGATALCVKNPALAYVAGVYHLFAEVMTPCHVSPLCTQSLRGYSARIGVGDAIFANIRGAGARRNALI